MEDLESLGTPQAWQRAEKSTGLGGGRTYKDVTCVPDQCSHHAVSVQRASQRTGGRVAPQSLVPVTSVLATWALQGRSLFHKSKNFYWGHVRRVPLSHRPAADPISGFHFRDCRQRNGVWIKYR